MYFFTEFLYKKIIWQIIEQSYILYLMLEIFSN